VVAASDEWPLGDEGFEKAPDAATLATNVASWFTGGGPGRFLMFSRNYGLVGNSLHSTLTGAGHTLVTKSEFTDEFTVENLASFDGVFVAGDDADNQVLIEYVEGGGSVYVAGGTGMGGVEADSTRWATFLARFNLKFSAELNQLQGNQEISSDHPIFQNVSTLYMAGGTDLELLDPGATSTMLVTDSQKHGLFAVADLTPQ
jgi:hypothetical protein